MTRKRFIKLLMSHGESKRKAQKIAYMYNVSGKSYKDAYFNYCGQVFFHRERVVRKAENSFSQFRS